MDIKLLSESVSRFFAQLNPQHARVINRAVAESTWPHNTPRPENLTEKMEGIYGRATNRCQLSSLRGPYGNHEFGEIHDKVCKRTWWNNRVPPPETKTSQGLLSKILYPGTMLYLRDRVPAQQKSKSPSLNDQLSIHLKGYEEGIRSFFKLAVENAAEASPHILLREFRYSDGTYGGRRRVRGSEDFWITAQDEVAAALHIVDTMQLGALDLTGKSLAGIDLRGMSIVGGNVDGADLTDARLTHATIVCKNLGSAKLPQDLTGVILGEFDAAGWAI